MHFLYGYGAKTGQSGKLVATFDSEEQLRSYVNWATLATHADGTAKFEQGSALVGCQRWQSTSRPMTDENPNAVVHNPSPSML